MTIARVSVIGAVLEPAGVIFFVVENGGGAGVPERCLK